MPQTLTDDQIDQMAQASPPSSAAKPLSDDDIDNLEAKSKASQPGIISRIIKDKTEPLTSGSLPIGANIPVLGPLAQKAGSAMAAGAATLYPGDKSFSDYYDQFNKGAQESLEQYAAKNPTANVLSSVAGAAMLPMPPAIKAAEGAGLGMRAGVGTANAMARVGTASAINAADAAVRGQDPEEAAKRTATVGGILEGAGGLARGASALAGPISSITQPAADALETAAANRATKAAFGNTPNFEKLRDQTQVGKDLLDNGVVGFGTKPATIAQRASSEKASTWKSMSGLLDSVDKDLTSDPSYGMPAGVDGTKIAQDIRVYADKIESPNNGSIVQNLKDQADKFEAKGQVPLSEAQRLKNLYKWDPRDPAVLPIGKDATNQVKSIIGDQMDDVVGAVDPQRAALYESLKKKYGSMASTEAGASKLADRFSKNRSLSLTDYLTGGFVAAASHGQLGPMGMGAAALGAAAGNRVLRERGSAALAVTYDKASQILAQTPDALGKFGPILQNAASRGTLPLTHALLMKSDPEYQELFNGAQK